MIGRTIWGLALTALAVLAYFAQLDHIAMHTRSAAGSVPVPMRAFAAQRLTEDAIQAQDAAAATRQARRLLRVRPLPAEHLTLLSLASSLSGDTATTIAALEAASQRGWRDPIVQLAAGEAALLENNHAAAAQRVSALLSTGLAPEETRTLLARLLSTPEGQAAFAQKMAVPGRWQGNMLIPALETVPPADLAKTVALAVEAGAPLACDRLNLLATSLRNRGEGAAAAMFWPGDCPQ